ncbi:hypothetical protein LSAT2_027132 [Lamellibrachia satsuma]|nr:hypothetical protein LSAT2_027132 [Lamellibrachia satsuma]
MRTPFGKTARRLNGIVVASTKRRYFRALTTSGQRMNSQCGMPCPDRYDVAECPDIRVKWEEGVSENCDQTRRWVACAGGVLKEVIKTESTCLADDNCAKQSCSSSAGLKERQFDAITSEADDPRIDVEQPDDINNSIIPVFLAQPRLRQQVRQAERRWRHTRLVVHGEIYAYVCDSFMQNITSVKSTHYGTEIESLIHDNRSKFPHHERSDGPLS